CAACRLPGAATRDHTETAAMVPVGAALVDGSPGREEDELSLLPVRDEAARVRRGYARRRPERMKGVLKAALWCAAVAHLSFGVAGVVFPSWFYSVVPPWPPLHAGQIQIAGVFDLALATLFFVGVSDIDRYLHIVVPVGVVAECGHALVRMGHVVAGDKPPGDRVAPTVMLLFGMFLLATGTLAREENRAARHGDSSLDGELPRA